LLRGAVTTYTRTQNSQGILEGLNEEVGHEIAQVEGRIQREEWASGYSITRILIIIIVLVTAMPMGN
jgi:hypothetical protein